MIDVVYAILGDGPLAGTVTEIALNERELQLPAADGAGVCMYKRIGWGIERAHRIAHFRYTHSLVI